MLDSSCAELEVSGIQGGEVPETVALNLVLRSQRPDAVATGDGVKGEKQ